MKCAICLRGAISKVTHRFMHPGELYNPGEYVNYIAVYNSIVKHIVNANPDVQFDFFIQCWNVDLEEDLVKLYNPKGTLFEDNNIYRDEILLSLQKTNRPIQDFGTTSQLLAISKSIKLLKDYTEVNNCTYNYVICYRPDVLLWKDMDLTTYDHNKIYVNAHPNAVGDFHFVMNLENAYEFSKIYDTTFYNNPVTNSYLHGKIKLYVQLFMHKELCIDGIVPGKDQEVLRKLKKAIIEKGHKMDFFYEYGLTEGEIEMYTLS
jgi:hypothetical protein